jgi:hypothetical protein
VLGGSDVALGKVAVQFRKLRPVQRQGRFTPAPGDCVTAQGQRERRHDGQGQQQERKPDHRI